MTELDLQWRPFRPEDETERNYVFSSWIQSYGVTSRRRWQRQATGIDEGGEFQGMRLNVYYELYDAIVRALLERSTIAVATTPDEPNIILGWMALEDGVLHYVHTKKRFRRFGVAKWMLEGVREIPLTYTHQFAFPVRSLIGARWTYDPMKRFPERKAA